MTTETPLPDADVSAPLAGFPHGYGWVPMVGFDSSSTLPWFGEIRRGTPAGPDVIYCGYHATPREAWTAVARYGRMMAEVYRSGDSTLLVLLKASIRYAARR